MECFNIVFVSVIQSFTTSGKELFWFDKENQRAILKRNTKFKMSRKHSKFLLEFKMAWKVMNRLTTNKKRQYYKNNVLQTISTNGNTFRDMKEIIGNRVETKQISLRIEGGATVGDGETVADLLNECFTTTAGNKLKQSRRKGEKLGSVYHQP